MVMWNIFCLNLIYGSLWYFEMPLNCLSKIIQVKNDVTVARIKKILVNKP